MTRPDRSRQNSQESHALTPAQATAVEMVALGKPDAEVATVAGVTRQTVNGWRHSSDQFIAAVNARRSELFSDSRERLRALAGRAVDALAVALDAGSVQAALGVLRAVRELPEPDAPTSPDGVLRTRAERAVVEEDRATPMTLIDTLTDDQTRPVRIRAAMDRLRKGG